MKRKEVAKTATKMIMEGKSHQETLDELLTLTKMPAEDIAKIIMHIPTLNVRKENKTANTILLIVLCLTILFKLIYGIPIIADLGLLGILLIFILPIMNIWFAISVAKYQAQIYKLVAIFTIISLGNNIDSILGASINIYLIIDLSIAAILIGLGFYLSSKMTAEYQTKKETYINENGQTRLRKTIKFIK